MRKATRRARLSQAELQAAQKDAQAMRAELESTRQTVASLQARDELSQIKIATLTSLIQKTPNALAVVAWDGDRQRGLVKTTNVPAIRPDQDYQLWIIDPTYKQPVSAGTFTAEGSAQFIPTHPISKATKFAVSLGAQGRRAGAAGADYLDQRVRSAMPATARGVAKEAAAQS